MMYTRYHQTPLKQLKSKLISLVFIFFIEYFYWKMVNKCRIKGCHINYQGYEIGAVKLPTDEDLKRKWIAFLDGEDVFSLKTQSHNTK